MPSSPSTDPIWAPGTHASIPGRSRQSWLNSGYTLPHPPGLRPVVRQCTATSLYPPPPTPPLPGLNVTATAPGSARALGPAGAPGLHQPIGSARGGSRQDTHPSLCSPHRRSSPRRAERGSQLVDRGRRYLSPISREGSMPTEVTGTGYRSSLKLWLQRWGHWCQGTEPRHALNSSEPRPDQNSMGPRRRWPIRCPGRAPPPVPAAQATPPQPWCHQLC